MSPLGRSGLIKNSENYFCRGTALAIISNEGLELHALRCDKSYPLMPANIVANVYRLEREHSRFSMREYLIVRFKNDQIAKLELKVDTAAPISPIALKEFQALCVMVHDI